MTPTAVRFEWGEQGARVLAAPCDVLVISRTVPVYNAGSYGVMA